MTTEERAAIQKAALVEKWMKCTMLPPAAIYRMADDAYKHFTAPAPAEGVRVKGRRPHIYEDADGWLICDDNNRRIHFADGIWWPEASGKPKRLPTRAAAEQFIKDHADASEPQTDGSIVHRVADLGPQRGPASTPQIQAQMKQARMEPHPKETTREGCCVDSNQVVIRKFCELQSKVWNAVIEPSHPSDCFCGELQGKATAPERTYQDGYRNDLAAFEFIERAALEEVAKHTKGKLAEPQTAERPEESELPDGDYFWTRRDGDWRIVTYELSHNCRDWYVGVRGNVFVNGSLESLPRGGWSRAVPATTLTALREQSPDGEFTCEAHPGKPWPHDDCAGPGMPWCNCERIITALREQLAQAEREIERLRPKRIPNGEVPPLGTLLAVKPQNGKVWWGHGPNETDTPVKDCIVLSFGIPDFNQEQNYVDFDDGEKLTAIIERGQLAEIVKRLLEMMRWDIEQKVEAILTGHDIDVTLTNDEARELLKLLGGDAE